jgi:hypothetical protein
MKQCQFQVQNVLFITLANAQKNDLTVSQAACTLLKLSTDWGPHSLSSLLLPPSQRSHKSMMLKHRNEGDILLST